MLEGNEAIMTENYTFEKFWEDLDNGFQIYFVYMKHRYLVYKMDRNCYRQELITNNDKTPHPKFSIITLKRLKELFPYVEELEYKV